MNRKEDLGMAPSVPVDASTVGDLKAKLQAIADQQGQRPDERKNEGVDVNPKDRLLKWFAFSHLPEHLQKVSIPFWDLADRLCSTVAPGPERTVALRKLLEAKDAAVRAALHPGG